MNSPTTREELLEKLSGFPEGPIDDEYLESIISSYLSTHWDELSGSREAAMSAMKFDRHEGLFFEPPSSITFKIERHGGTVMGSHYGELQEWSMDLEHMAATHYQGGKRRLTPIDKKLDIRPLVEKVVNAINEVDTSNTVIKWLSENRIKVLAGNLIPETYKQTTANRRKRFRLALEEELAKSG